MSDVTAVSTPAPAPAFQWIDPLVPPPGVEVPGAIAAAAQEAADLKLSSFTFCTKETDDGDYLIRLNDAPVVFHIKASIEAATITSEIVAFVKRHAATRA